MARRPKGSYFRNTPDWFFNLAASVGANNPGSAGTNAVCDLFNDASDGSLLYIYAIESFNLGTQSIRVQQFSGHVTGGTSGPSYAVNPNVGKLPGTLYIAQIAGISQPNTDPYIFSVNSTSDEYINPGGPVMIVPPGYSCRLYNNAVAFGFTCWFYYVVLRDQGG